MVVLAVLSTEVWYVASSALTSILYLNDRVALFSQLIDTELRVCGAPRSTRHHCGNVPSLAAHLVVRLPSLPFTISLPTWKELAVAGCACDNKVPAAGVAVGVGEAVAVGVERMVAVAVGVG